MHVRALLHSRWRQPWPACGTRAGAWTSRRVLGQLVAQLLRLIAAGHHKPPDRAWIHLPSPPPPAAAAASVSARLSADASSLHSLLIHTFAGRH